MTSERILMTGNDAVGAGAIQAGCDCYFGYPITPQNELTAYMARHMPENGRVFVQAESELAAVNMVFGASSAGARAMTSSSSPGVSLKQEGISFLACAELPSVIVNVQRGGPGLGNIAPAQADYFQAVKGGGHGDYHQIVLAPFSVQETYDLTMTAFDLADRYRTPVMVLTDGRLGQMMEPMTPKARECRPPPKPWALSGADGRAPNIVRSLYLVENELTEVNRRLQAKYAEIVRKEVRYETQSTEDCELLLIAYGSSARIASGAVIESRRQGIRTGLLRPVSLWPFPDEAVRKLAGRVRAVMVVELSAGQMREDVDRAVQGQTEVHLESRLGGSVFTVADVVAHIKEIAASWQEPIKDPNR